MTTTSKTLIGLVVIACVSAIAISAASDPTDSTSQPNRNSVDEQAKANQLQAAATHSVQPIVATSEDRKTKSSLQALFARVSAEVEENEKVAAIDRGQIEANTDACPDPDATRETASESTSDSGSGIAAELAEDPSLAAVTVPAPITSDVTVVVTNEDAAAALDTNNELASGAASEAATDPAVDAGTSTDTDIGVTEVVVEAGKSEVGSTPSFTLGDSHSDSDSDSDSDTDTDTDTDTGSEPSELATAAATGESDVAETTRDNEASDTTTSPLESDSIAGETYATKIDESSDTDASQASFTGDDSGADSPDVEQSSRTDADDTTAAVAKETGTTETDRTIDDAATASIAASPKVIESSKAPVVIPDPVVDTNSSKDVAAPAKDGPAATTGSALGAVNGPLRTYTIKLGDTFSSIAKKELGAEKHWQKIIIANPKINPKSLRVGQVIKLPKIKTTVLPTRAAGTDFVLTPTPTPTPGVAPTPLPADVYLVRPGETLWAISKKHYKTGDLWQHIYKANKTTIGSNPSKLRAGMKITIPPKPSR